MRSLLFVPGDSRRKLDRAWNSGADALILDLEDSVAASGKAAARDLVADFLVEARSKHPRPRMIVRINALASGLCDADLDGVMAAGPDVIMLPKARGGTDISHLAAKLAVREAEHALDDGSTAIIAIATETADAIFGLHSYARSSHRLLGLTWGAEDLAADIGAEANRVGGEMTEPFRLARNLMLFAAAAAEVIPIDTVHVDIRDAAGLESECRAARRDGFAGKMAIHPDQIAVINRVFTPDPAEIARARAILAHFEANPDSGVVAIDGKMVDRPHLRSAARLMERARAAGVA